MRHHQGWTLIELLITLTIGCLLLGFGIQDARHAHLPSGKSSPSAPVPMA